MFWFKWKKGLSCEEFRLLMYAYSENDPDLTQEYREKFERHLQSCPSCQIEYEEDQMLPELLKDWDPSTSQRPVLKFKTTQDAWEDLKRRILEYEDQQRQIRQKRIRKICQIGTTVAASIVIAIGIGWFSCKGRGSKPQTPIAVNALAETGILENAIAELVTSQGKTPLQFNQPITAGDSPQEILLGGMHRVVMNSNTAATFSVEPVDTQTEHRARYAIQLSKGEIYVEVVPGHPFLVKTNNALLNITGTKFNVTADSNETKLTLLKGSVRFSNLGDVNEFVDVTTGYSSLIKGYSLPEPPLHTNALTATAWARDFVMSNTLAHIQPGLDEDFLESIRDSWMRPTPPDLKEIDYQQWRDDHQDWFKQQFPWIFEIQTFLYEQHNIEADYIDLLMISGDIWQFNYPRSLGQPIPICNSNSIERLNKHYDVKLEQFKSFAGPDNLPSAKPSEIYQDSLANWHSAIINAGQNQEGNLSNELLLFNLRAGQYLTNTRTGAYLWVKENPEKAKQLISDQNYYELFLPEELANSVVSNEILETYLADQVSDVSAISSGSQELFTTPKTSGCQENTTKLVRQLQDGLSEFMHGGIKK